jgi:hypothetical protein
MTQQQAMQAQRDIYRNFTVQQLRAKAQSAPYATSQQRATWRTWADRINSGSSVPTVEEIDAARPASTQGLSADWGMFGGTSPNYSGMSGSQIVQFNQGFWAQARDRYSGFLAQDSEMSLLQQQIAALQQQYAAEQAAAAPAPSAGQEAAPAASQTAPQPLPTPEPEDRNRQRRDLTRSFGVPRYGVGLNIPLGT